MFFEILIKTIQDAFPLLMGILAIMAVINLIIFVGTHDSRPRAQTKRTMDMVNSTRFMSLE